MGTMLRDPRSPVLVRVPDCGKMKALSGRGLVMLEMAIAVGALLVVILGLLWLRPWVDDHYHPYE